MTVARVSAIDSDYLETEIKANVRARPIAWDLFLRTKELTDDETNKIKALVLLTSAAQRRTTIEQAPAVYATTLLSVLNRLKRDDVVKLLLVLLNDLLLEVELFAEELFKLTLVADTLPYEPFAKLVDLEDEAIQLVLLYNLVLLLSATPYTAHGYASQTVLVLTRIVGLLTNLDNVLVAVQLLERFLRTGEYRVVFWRKNPALFPPVLQLLKLGQGDLQLKYRSLLILWLLTFNEEVLVEMPLKYPELLLVLQEVARNTIKEKITRLSIAILVNMVVKKLPATAAAKDKVAKVLLLLHVMPLLKTFGERRWLDEELVADLKTLNEVLGAALELLLLFDEYLIELDSGKLTPLPPHTLEEFWHRHAGKFKENNYKLFKQLLALLKQLPPVTGQQIVLNDITRVVQHVPGLHKVVEQSGVKPLIMDLMTLGSPEVRYEALKTTQALVAASFAS